MLFVFLLPLMLVNKDYHKQTNKQLDSRRSALRRLYPYVNDDPRDECVLQLGHEGSVLIQVELGSLLLTVEHPDGQPRRVRRVGPVRRLKHVLQPRVARVQKPRQIDLTAPISIYNCNAAASNKHQTCIKSPAKSQVKSYYLFNFIIEFVQEYT